MKNMVVMNFKDFITSAQTASALLVIAFLLLYLAFYKSPQEASSSRRKAKSRS